MSYYTDRINAAQDFETLCNIVEEAADDDRITNVDYCNVYAICVDKAQTMGMKILKAEHIIDCAVACRTGVSL